MTAAGELGPDEFVTQYVTDPLTQVARNRLRSRDLDGLSAIRGVLTPAEAYRLVRSVAARRAPPSGLDGVRYARVGDLRDAGFTVAASPTKRNQEHVSIAYPGVWTDGIAATFDGVFSEPHWHVPEGG